MFEIGSGSSRCQSETCKGRLWVTEALGTIQVLKAGCEQALLSLDFSSYKYLKTSSSQPTHHQAQPAHRHTEKPKDLRDRANVRNDEAHPIIQSCVSLSLEQFKSANGSNFPKIHSGD